MDNKRKAPANRAALDEEERSSKRRRLPQQEVDLSNGETPETTTEIGLTFLEQIRRTADKSGRLVAVHFEKPLSREDNAEYYRKTRLPISLQDIESKLKNKEFKNLTELESYFKRMVTNAKEFYPRNSQTYEDAERVRKAVSNYMVKRNPAYLVKGFSATATPLPPEEPTTAEANVEGAQTPSAQQSEGNNADAEAVTTMNGHATNDAKPEGDDGEGEDEEEVDEEAGEDEDEEDGENSEDGQDEENDVLVIPKKRGPGRPPKNPILHAKKMAAKAARQGKADSQYQDVPYKGLNFQQAQEKLVEELLRKRTEDDEEEYFGPFIDLPPRSLKDYFRIISEPLSIRKLQRMVRGARGRGATGISDFKSWSAFEDKASLLWKNACYYNEEGSDIYELAKELEEFFHDQLGQAQEVVQEPPQSKIKIKVPSSGDTPVPSSKKITIHVGGRSTSAESPAPLQSAGSQASESTPVSNTISLTRRSVVTGTPVVQADQPRGMATTSPGPAQLADQGRPVMATTPSRGPGGSLGQGTPLDPARPAIQMPNGSINVGATLQQAIAPPQPAPPPAPPRNPIWDQPLRQPGKGLSDGLMASLVIQAHPSVAHDEQFQIVLRGLKQECFRSEIHHLPTKQGVTRRVCILPHATEYLEKTQPRYQLWMIHNGRMLHAQRQGAGPGQLPMYETYLGPGVNTIEAHLVAEIPSDKRQPDGPEAELEKFILHVNILRE